MRKLGTATFVLVLLGWAQIGNAEIIDAVAMDDGDGALVCGAGCWGSATQTMTIVGNLWWAPGHVGVQSLDPLAPRAAYFTTDTEADPTVTMRNTIDNDTGFSWTAYHINVYMNKSFTLSSATIYTPDTSEPGWSGIITTPNAQWNGSEWVGQVDYYGGTPIPDGGTIDFSYKMQFTGSVQYCQEMIPIPEPGTAALLLSGVAGLLVWLRKRR